jgi:hypothetical protein
MFGIMPRFINHQGLVEDEKVILIILAIFNDFGKNMQNFHSINHRCTSSILSF